MTDIAIVGAGNVGKALATSLSRAGHAVTIASRDPQDAAEAAAATGSASSTSVRDAVAEAEVVIIAVGFASSGEDVAREIAPIVAGKIVVDVTNPLKPTYDGLVTERGPSAAERFAAWLPDAHVVKAFNTLFAANQIDPILDGTRLDGFVAGDDDGAKATVLELVRSIGLRPIDAGPLARARELEALAWLNIALQGSLGNTWHTAWKLVGVPVGVVEGEKAAA
jgi:NADPH-dependent F420 reductase